ncbi:MAG: GMP synthase [Bacteroidetes bacterium]|nr:MAG: GMP synthase [Bacteroidota bacterium]TAG90711.1 MAG: GMP synthase [Bacteroidota bacterium]
MRDIQKVAILDLYNGMANLGMKNIQEILTRYSKNSDTELQYDIFDVRQKEEVPNIDNYDIYISTGGPGSPFEGEGKVWEKNYFSWLDKVYNFNQKNNDSKKHAFFICHSFQMISRFFEIGNVCKRKSLSFGIFPMHHTELGWNEPFFSELPEPFYAVDNRYWQLIEPNHAKLKSLGAEILSIEKERPHVDLERAVMAIRFSPEMFAVQFHPEADPIGMETYFNDPKKKIEIIESHGQQKYDEMCDFVNDEDKIILTQKVIIPNFLQNAINSKQLQMA